MKAEFSPIKVCSEHCIQYDSIQEYPHEIVGKDNCIYCINKNCNKD